MKILVLGGTGAMGNDLVRILANEDRKVIVTSRTQRQSKNPNIKYVQGNAMDDYFLEQLVIGTFYDTIVDFMNYSTDAFNRRVEMLLNSTNQYVYFSSSRVYAYSQEPITEDCARLLDACDDSEYQNTDEYGLAKARQEDILNNSEKKNWTIIRPYITYSNIRLQLGFQEKELWLYRMLHGRTIVFSKDIGEKYTTLTWGGDVASALTRIIGNPNTLGQIYHITHPETMKWKNVLEIYLNTVEEVTGHRPRVIMENSSAYLGKVTGRQMQRKYDRLYDRRFDNSKIAVIYPDINKSLSIEDGLKKCLTEFLNGKAEFRDIDWKAEGYMDKVTHEHTPLAEIPGQKDKLRYLIARYTPYFEKR